MADLNKIKKLLSDDDKVMRDIMAKEMLRKIEARIESKQENAFKTIKNFLEDETKSTKAQAPKEKK